MACSRQLARHGQGMGMSTGATRVTAAILLKDGLVLLARRRYDDRLAGHWEFPGGKVEAGETTEECLAGEFASCPS